MEKPKVLSGQALVAKGVTRIDATLPEIGLKDVIPNGSWLEQKQIQAALEARKHLIEVERIEKLSTLSHATWREDLNLAEVTQKSGGYWQYLGHNVGKTLFLRPEEALFLMELNCLLLKHDGVKVSLQKAYSLLLNETTLTQYRVYASLSRLGYKVFKHKGPKGRTETKFSKSTLENKCHNVNDQQKVDARVDTINNNINLCLDSCQNSENICQPASVIQLSSSAEETTVTETCKMDSAEPESCTTRKGTLCSLEGDHSNCKKECNKSKNNEANVDIEDKAQTEGNVNNGADEIQSIESKSNETKDCNASGEDKDVMEIDKTNELNTETASQDVNELLYVNISSTLNEVITPIIDEIMENVYKATENGDCRKSDVENRKNLSHLKIMDINAQEVCHTDLLAIHVGSTTSNVHSAITIDVNSDSDVIMDLDTPTSQDNNVDTNVNNRSETHNSLSEGIIDSRNEIFHNYITKLKRLTSRQIKPSDFKSIEKHFENVPDLFKKEVVTINAPDQQHMPKNIFVNKSCYVLNLKQIKKKCIRSVSMDSTAYNSSDEVNGNHVRRIRSTSSSELSQNLQFMNNMRLPPRQNIQFRPFGCWRPQNNLNYVQFNMFFQRPFYPNNMFVHSRFQYHQRPLLRPFSSPSNFNLNANNPNDNNARKRMRSGKACQLQCIKNLAVRLKQLIMSGNNHIQNVESLLRLLYVYNTKYKTRLRLTKDFEVINEETILETIELEDDEESKSKRPRVSSDSDMFNENLNLLRQLASKLKDLEAKDMVTSKHRRALSKAIKTFNKSYNADIYMNNNFEVIDKRYISIESDSETECVLQKPEKPCKRKKLRNPFNILKRRSEKLAANASTSKENASEESDSNNTDFKDDTQHRKDISKVFNSNWLPREDDFGRPELVHKNEMNSRLINSIKEDCLFNFMKNHSEDLNNWLEAKVSFLQHMEEIDRDIALQNEHARILSGREFDNSGLKPLIDADCSDMSTVLQNLRIIKHNNEIAVETSLSIDFDVYNRDVPNFRKTNPPKPHFRFICLEESSNFPSAAEVSAVTSRYDDNVPIVFAIVGISSVSYLQMKPIDLPVYVPCNDFD